MIQIIGTKKNRATQHALRFFKERRITFQWRDLTEKGLSRGELENIRSRLKAKLFAPRCARAKVLIR